MSVYTEITNQEPLPASDSLQQSLQKMVIRQHRSLLQYADLCWPWVDLEESAERNILKSLAARQRMGTRELVLLLDSRAWPVDYGQFPIHYTDLNFVALDHLWPQVVKSESDLLAELHNLRRSVVGDAEAVRAVDRCINNQSEILSIISEHVIDTTHTNKRYNHENT